MCQSLKANGKQCLRNSSIELGHCTIASNQSIIGNGSSFEFNNLLSIDKRLLYIESRANFLIAYILGINVDMYALSFKNFY
jgi:hypothetical protein